MATSTVSANPSNNSTIWGQFFPLVSVFFFWGFVAASNDILIPVFRKEFDLSNTQGQFVAFAFYIAYTVGSLAYMGLSKLRGRDVINSLGYKNALIIGLVVSALGTLLFIPAANNRSFELMLSGLFIVGLGFSLQQTVANPLAILMGPRKTGSQRLTLAGGINNLGTTIGPLIVSFAIFGSVLSDNTEASIESVKTPYLILGAAFLVVAVVLKFTKLPDQDTTEEIEEDNETNDGKERSSAFKYPQLLLGMVAIFVYVGVEVSTASNLPEYMEKVMGFETKDIAPYISLYWASLMIGRWSGAIEAFNPKKDMLQFLKFLAPYLAFGVFLAVNAIMKHDLTPFYYYAALIVVLILADMASKGNPVRMLLIFSLMGILSLLIGIFGTGMVSVYAFTSVGLFCSTLWPCIFTIAIAGLGKHTNTGSSLLIMMIMGGAFIPLTQGFVADYININYSYFVGVACFAYLAFYAVRGGQILKKQGIDYDELT
ncbi:sugar MFS transporter [Weeksellaceae bacterium KMM 9724]|uniref:sugar MFS transporter n=1 Tax=Profundicola chukchiensis TaxID=2961959 RepID=UPI002438152D|nr:sugar MFS transporter [Profundicola chukchiensis]MDG4949950.1 sugar MFS transporter [Profundicola chukchiensis]